MATAWIHSVAQGSGNDLALAQLSELKHGLHSALAKRDWPQVARIDRLSAQIIYSLGPNDRATMVRAVAGLIEIKKLYQRSLQLIEKELTDLSNQAY